jgi:enhancing lycopene biosynthesis protein 2
VKTVAVILSGCGFQDGAEITEAVLTLLALDRRGVRTVCAAPDIQQAELFDHQKGVVDAGRTRSVLAEAARIARGPVRDVSELAPEDYDAVVLPGGWGAVKNLSNFAFDQGDFRVDGGLASFLTRFHAMGRPMGFICIAPAIAARLFGKEGVRFTVGTDTTTGAALAAHGGTHVECPVDDIVVDEALNIVTTPAYMLATRPTEAEAGITKLVDAVLARTGTRRGAGAAAD